MTDFFKPADSVMVDVQIPPEAAHRAMAICRLEGRYLEPILQPRRVVEVVGAPAPAAPKAPVRLSVKKVQQAHASPSSGISENDERRILIKMEQLLKNETRILDVEEENRVLTRMVMRLQAEIDALKARG